LKLIDTVTGLDGANKNHAVCRIKSKDHIELKHVKRYKEKSAMGHVMLFYLQAHEGAARGF